MIPELIDNVLPEGIHGCTIDEVASVFGRFSKTDQRIKLTQKLRRFIEDATKSGIVAAVIIDGSYGTGKASPQDIDIIVALKPSADLMTIKGAFVQMLSDRKAVKREYGFDVKAVPDGSVNYVSLWNSSRT